MDRGTKQVDVTIGLDLGDRRSQAAVLDAGGVLIEERSVATTKEGMAEVFGQYGGCRIVMEVGTHSPWVSRLFKERGFEVIVANPRQVRLIAASQRKTDRYDARCWRGWADWTQPFWRRYSTEAWKRSSTGP
ncbi:MAG: transposase [Ardenticatenia bacterium]|nr:transposase [Ardenticatenia bacterium]